MTKGVTQELLPPGHALGQPLVWGATAPDGAVPMAVHELASTPARTEYQVPTPRPPQTVELGAFISTMNQQSLGPGE